jgi:hypothetical protein
VAFKHGRTTVVFMDGWDVSAYLKEHSFEGSSDVPPTTTFGNTAVRRQVVGLEDGSLSLGGFHDTTAGGTWALFSAALGAASASVLSIGDEGTTIGLPAKLASGRAAAVDKGSAVDAVIETSLQMQADGGVDYGKWQLAKAAVGSSGNSASIDGGAATATGWVAHIHATAVSGTSPTLDSKIQDSADDSAWADLSGAAFTQITAANVSQRLEGAATATVRRYTREVHTIGGSDTPTVTAAVALARR